MCVSLPPGFRLPEDGTGRRDAHTSKAGGKRIGQALPAASSDKGKLKTGIFFTGLPALVIRTTV